MIFGKRRRERIKQNITDNLTLCRLEGDLLAVEAAIRDNAPRTSPEEGGPIKRFINNVINDLNNSVRRFNTQELSVDRAKAQNALKAFRSEHSTKDFEISEDVEGFRKYIDKHLFKKDNDGVARLCYALIFALEDKEREYQCPEESLEVVSEILFNDPKRLGILYSRYRKNYEALYKNQPNEFEIGLNLGSGLGSLLALSVLPVCVTGLVTLISYARNKRAAAQAFKNLSPSETNATLAFYLTLIEEISDEEKRREMIDELLKKVDNIRADAEYKWYVEGEDIPDCKTKIEACELTLKRLGHILGR